MRASSKRSDRLPPFLTIDARSLISCDTARDMPSAVVTLLDTVDSVTKTSPYYGSLYQNEG